MLVVTAEFRRLRSVALRNNLDPDKFLPEDCELLAVVSEEDSTYVVDQDLEKARRALQDEQTKAKEALATRSKLY